MMTSPFPGMDPYLEQSSLWGQVHYDLMGQIRSYLLQKLAPHYYVGVEQTTYLSIMPPHNAPIGRPDIFIANDPNGTAVATKVKTISTGIMIKPKQVEIPQPIVERQHRYLIVRHIETQELITVIEIVSPANKIGLIKRKLYEDKCLQILNSLTHFVEIDLLRVGERLLVTTEEASDYRILVSQAHKRPQADIYPFNLPDIIPDIAIPLREPDESIPLPLNQILHAMYIERRYDLIINYDKPVSPKLSDENQVWATKLTERG
ncbi:DUF4058 family protein [Anaerolineales bacterium HSG6]|nr:DUF4058 family protein [Anaerolineales bacterium HSG6]